MQDDFDYANTSVKERWKNLGKEKQTAIILFMIAAIFVLVFTGLKIREGINAPFLVPISNIQVNKDLLKDPVAEQTAYEKRIDTDGDGISDWAEVNVYKTSPYLWSTAGDNIPDNVKIAMGMNPFCKAGEACDTTLLKFNLPTSTPIYDNLFTGQDAAQKLGDYLISKDPGAQAIQQDAQAAGINMDPASQIPRDPVLLRKALLDSGKVTQDDLNKITDEELLKLLDETLAEQKAASASSTKTTIGN